MKKIILLALTALMMVGCDWNSNYEIDTKTQYSYRTISTITSSDTSPQAQGYELKGSNYSNWSSFSDWSTTRPSGN